MGCNTSTTVVITNAVDAQLVEAQEMEKYNHKILLLGAGESGKSTVVKQIKLIWKVGGGPSEKEKQEYILAIRRNCIEAIQTLLEASKNLDVPLKNKDLQPVFEKLLAYDTNNPVTTDIGNDINALWRDEGIQVCRWPGPALKCCHPPCGLSHPGTPTLHYPAGAGPVLLESPPCAERPIISKRPACPPSIDPTTHPSHWVSISHTASSPCASSQRHSSINVRSPPNAALPSPWASPSLS